MKLIELNLDNSDRKILVNLETVSCVIEGDIRNERGIDYKSTIYFAGDKDDFVVVKESYSQVLDRLKHCEDA